jgi:hypothetical protein
MNDAVFKGFATELSKIAAPTSIFSETGAGGALGGYIAGGIPEAIVGGGVAATVDAKSIGENLGKQLFAGNKALQGAGGAIGALLGPALVGWLAGKALKTIKESKPDRAQLPPVPAMNPNYPNP